MTTRGQPDIESAKGIAADAEEYRSLDKHGGTLSRLSVSKKVQELFCRHLGGDSAEAIAMFVDGYCYRYDIPFGDGQIAGEAKRRMFAGESFTPKEFESALGASSCQAVIPPQFEALTGIPFSKFTPMESQS